MWLNDLLSATPLSRAWPTECDSPETLVDRVRLERHVASGFRSTHVSDCCNCCSH